MEGLRARIRARNWSESRLAPLLAFTVPLFLSLGLLVLFVDFENRRYHQEVRAKLTDELSNLRGRMESEINKTMYLTRGLTAYVAVHPNPPGEIFHALSTEILRDNEHIRNLGLAPDNVVRYIHPLEGNEAAMGLEYRKNQEQWPSVARMMRLKTTIVAGPVNLVQGGRAFVARTPVYTGEGENRNYWGLISVVIDTDSLLSASGLTEEKKPHIALRGNDGTGERGKIFWGNPEVFENDPVLLQIQLPEGSWQMGGTPSGGWRSQSPQLGIIWTLGSGLSLLLSTLFYLWVFRQRNHYMELRKISTEAEAANRSKGEFLANMSHEIRTPLNATLGFADLLSDQLIDPTHKKYLDAIRRNGHSLLNLLNDILDLSRIEAGKLQISPTSCDWRQLVEEIGDVFSFMMEQKALRWSMDVDPNLPAYILIDAHRLRQILLNLVGNAVKFTASGSVIVRVRGERQPDHTWNLKISVLDTGPGISEDLKTHIFEAFVQDQAVRSEVQEGTGLGLTISSRLAHLLGGHIELDSQVGRGSTFSLVLNNLETGRPELPSIQEERAPVPLKDRRILIVDDNEDNRNLIHLYLRKEHMQVKEATNGKEALSVARNWMPDIMLLDLHMPVMDGFTVLEHLKEMPEMQSMRVVLFTADAMEENMNRMRNYNTAGILTKPLTRQKLLISLQQALSRD